jgi:hypothetical protein
MRLDVVRAGDEGTHYDDPAASRAFSPPPAQVSVREPSNQQTTMLSDRLGPHRPSPPAMTPPSLTLTTQRVAQQLAVDAGLYLLGIDDSHDSGPEGSRLYGS